MRFSLAALLLGVWVCGVNVSNTQSAQPRYRRLVGGTLAPQVPWQAMIFHSDNVLDGGYAAGALISDRWVLTAGRNLFIRKSREDARRQDLVIPKVYVGITERVEAVAANERAVEQVVLHPGFQNQSDWDNDVALIKLKEPVLISDKLMPIPLPERGHRLDNVLLRSGVLAGWGWGALLTPAGSLKHLVVPLASQSACEAQYKNDPHTPTVDDNMFCTEPTKYGENVCFGDAGGALVVTDAESGDVYAAGILSYDKACSTRKFGVYMKLTSYLPWIHSVIRGDTERSSALRQAVMKKFLEYNSPHTV